MKKFYFCLLALVLASAGFLYDSQTSAHVETKADGVELISPHLVISQFQTGRASPDFNDEFVEIFNKSASPVDLNGYRLVYRSQNNSNDVPNPFAVWTNSTIVPAGGYYLIASTSYDGAATPDITYNPSACSCSMSGTNGGLALRNGPNNTGTIIDSVAWGTVTNGFNEGTPTTPHPLDSNDNSKARKQNGCQDTDNNANDFETLTPSTPRNTASIPFQCSGSGSTLFAFIQANPTTITPPGNTLLTVSVIPATTPPSTGITVVGNLTDVGGPASQPFFDDGTNGDVTAGDNVFSYRATIPIGTTGGTHVVTAVAADAEGRSVPLVQNLTINAAFPLDDPLLFGNPSGATAETANENNYLMPKPQYTLSYNRGKATANWVAWRLDSTWIGDADRQDDFRPDPALPAGWYHVLDSDYSGSGYQRGHMCPSGDRTRSVEDNSATFLMTNIVPQISENNERSWADFEIYCRTLAAQGSEIYIISGPSGNIGTIASGRIVVPAVTWKVVLILPNGNNDLQRVTRATRAFGIIVPNQLPINSNVWRSFRVTVNEVEYLTGHNFFSEIPKNTQELIERKRDTQ